MISKIIICIACYAPVLWIWSVAHGEITIEQKIKDISQTYRLALEEGDFEKAAKYAVRDPEEIQALAALAKRNKAFHHLNEVSLKAFNEVLAPVRGTPGNIAQASVVIENDRASVYSEGGRILALLRRSKDGNWRLIPSGGLKSDKIMRLTQLAHESTQISDDIAKQISEKKLSSWDEASKEFKSRMMTVILKMLEIAHPDNSPASTQSSTRPH